MNHSLNILKGGYIGDYITDYNRGDARNLDYSSNEAVSLTSPEPLTDWPSVGNKKEDPIGAPIEPPNDIVVSIVFCVRWFPVRHPKPTLW